MPLPVQYLTETATPSSPPPAGMVAFYFKSDGQPYFMGPNGVETAFETPIGSISASWPVGSIFIGATSTNPATLLGVGTWTQIAQGQMIVGQKTGDPNFGTAGNTGGATTHTISTGELPSHSHSLTMDPHNHSATDSGHSHSQQSSTVTTVVGGSINLSAAGANSALGGTTQSGTASISVANTTATGTVGNTGSGTAMSILNPYLVVYVWQRTA